MGIKNHLPWPNEILSSDGPTSPLPSTSSAPLCLSSLASAPECATSKTKGQIHTSWRESGFEDLEEELLLTVKRKELSC